MTTPPPVPPNPHNNPGENSGEFGFQQSPYGYPGTSPQQPTPPPYEFGGQTPPPAKTPVSKEEAGGFFKALFDLNFNSFVTLKFAKIIYVLAMVVLAITYFILVVTGFADSAGTGIAFLLLGWIPVLIYLVLIRVSIEFAVAMIRTAQNTGEMAAQGRATN